MKKIICLRCQKNVNARNFNCTKDMCPLDEFVETPEKVSIQQLIGAQSPEQTDDSLTIPHESHGSKIQSGS